MSNSKRRREEGGSIFDKYFIVKELAKEVKFKYKFYMVPGGGYGSLKNGRSILITIIIIWK